MVSIEKGDEWGYRRNVLTCENGACKSLQKVNAPREHQQSVGDLVAYVGELLLVAEGYQS